MSETLTPPTTWAEVLDALEQELDVLEWALESGDLEAPPHSWRAPSGLPPLTTEEIDRALRLNDRLQACVDGLARRRTTVGEELRSLPRRREAASRYLARR